MLPVVKCRHTHGHMSHQSRERVRHRTARNGIARAHRLTRLYRLPAKTMAPASASDIQTTGVRSSAADTTGASLYRCDGSMTVAFHTREERQITARSRESTLNALLKAAPTALPLPRTHTPDPTRPHDKRAIHAHNITNKNTGGRAGRTATEDRPQCRGCSAPRVSLKRAAAAPTERPKVKRQSNFSNA